MPDLDARRREALRRVVAEHHPTETECGPPFCRPCSEAIGDWVQWTPTHAADALAPLVAGWLAEERDEAYSRALRDAHKVAERAAAHVAQRALREAAEDFATGAWADAWGSDGVDDDVSAVRSTERWLLARADRVGGAR